MTAWRKLALLGLAVSMSVAGCVVNGDDDDDGIGGSSGGGTGGKAGGAGKGGTGGTAGASGASGSAGTSGSGGVSGGGAGGTAAITCDPSLHSTECGKCYESAKCCTEFEACANDTKCGALEASNTKCVNACKQAICDTVQGTPCTESQVGALPAAQVTACTDQCGAPAPATGEFECTLRCIQAAASEAGLTDAMKATCAGGCASDNAATPTSQLSELIGCIAADDTTGCSTACFGAQ
jgi:hypothetical protein